MATKTDGWDTGSPSRTNPKRFTRAEVKEMECEARERPSLGSGLIRWYFETGIYVLVDDDGRPVPLRNPLPQGQEKRS